MGLRFGSPRIPTVFDDAAFWVNFPQHSKHQSDFNEVYDTAQGLRLFQNGNAPARSSEVDMPGLGSDFKAPIFNGSRWFRCIDAAGTRVDMAGATTLVMWLKSFNMTERDTVFEKAGTTNNSYEQEIACTWETGETISWYSRQGSYDYASVASIGTSGDWKMVGIKMSTGKISGVNRNGYYSVDGANWTANYTNRSTNVITPAGELRIGNGYAGVVEGGAVSQVLVWERELTNTEINNVWNTTRSWHQR